MIDFITFFVRLVGLGTVMTAVALLLLWQFAKFMARRSNGRDT